MVGQSWREIELLPYVIPDSTSESGTLQAHFIPNVLSPALQTPRN